jgi:hypothetical protein
LYRIEMGLITLAGFSIFMTDTTPQYLGVEGLRVVLFGFQLTLIGLLSESSLPLVGIGVAVSLLGLVLPN